MTRNTCPQNWGPEMCAFAHDHGDKAPMPGEPDRAVEDDWFTYAAGAQPVALGDVVQIGPGCFRAMAAAIEE